MFHGRTATFAGTLVILMLTMIPAFAHIPIGHGTKPPPSPPPSTGTSWTKAYNIPYSYARAESIAQTTGGGYVVGGSCEGGTYTSACADVSEPAAIVMTVDSSGNIQSQTQYLYKNYPYSTPSGLIRPTADGGAIFAGNAQFGCPATGQTSCASIVKVDPTGKIQWANDLQFSTSSSYGPETWPFDLQTTTDGGFVIAGYTFAPAGSYNPFVFKLDSTGALVWQHSYLVGDESYVDSLALTSDGGYIVSGSASATTGTSYSSSILLLKLDSAGNPQFARTYTPSGSISDLNIIGAQQTADGGYAFAGYYFQNTIYDYRAWLVKTDSAGNVQWDKIYGADVQYSDRKFLSSQQTSDGGFIAAGYANQYDINNGYNSLWIVKTDSNGNISGCSDVKNGSDTSGSATVKVSNTDLTAAQNSVSYVADTLNAITAPFKATKEC